MTATATHFTRSSNFPSIQQSVLLHIPLCFREADLTPALGVGETDQSKTVCNIQVCLKYVLK